ncbi:hypothetical protein JL722_6755 [Aureococcus anophagefferens]|nr:hypothetical protein JL722_6755 [Aureococcus anophagefferens]
MQAVHDNIERHERELNAILKHHQIHLYGQKDKKYLMVQSSFDAWKIMVHHNRRRRRRRRELEAKRPPPQKNRGHGAFRKMGKSPKSSPTPPGGAIENGDDVPETNDDDDDGDDDDDDDDTSKKVVEGIPEIGHRPLLQRGEGHSICSAKQNVDGREAPEGGKKTPTSKSEEDKLEVAIKYKRRYQNVFSEGVDTSAEIAKTAAMEKDATVTAFLIAALRQNFVFASLEDAEVSKIVEFMAKTSVGKGTDAIKQGEQGDYFYIVEEGKFDFMVKGKVVGSCGKKDSFGELALLYGAPRAATVRATTAATVWQLDRVTFRSTVASGASKQKQRVMDSLSHVTLLEGLTDDQLKRVADAVQIVRYPAGKRIIQKNETGNVFYMIQEGAVDCTDVGASNQFKDLVLKDGEYFGSALCSRTSSARRT